MSTANFHTMQYYCQKEAAVFASIPGMDDLLQAGNDTLTDAETKYPDAAFALMISNNLLCGDRELNEIHQRAYLSILKGECIKNVRRRFDVDMSNYVTKHMWDD